MNVPPDILGDKEFMDLYKDCRPFTMTSPERMYSLYNSVNYVLDKKIPGDFVECGVWRGGSSMMIAKCLAKRGVQDRKIYLYDTYEGMSKPDDNDFTVDTKEDAMIKFESTSKSEDSSDWCYASIDEVKQNMFNTGYNQKNLHFIKGKVEDTIPGTIPGQIALLRLDTDWYQSTKHELEYLYPLLEKNGVLIIDDFGHWEGCKKAVVEYFDNDENEVLLGRIDRAGRIVLKA
ncbi:TylF/MycF/NovP-related O-methyltransferase [Neolewinella aurantiaca]|nr:TylF/MycF/NovP-related O-methyltransferase [Neolewinella aurantiaca]